LQGFAYEVLKMAKKADHEKKLEDPKGDFPKLTKRSTTSMVDPTPMSQKESRSLVPERS
jgi:hypothetical protein